MTSVEFIADLAKNLEVTKKEAKEITEIFIDTLIDSFDEMVVGENLNFVGSFGFTKVETGKRTNKMPNGQPDVVIPPKFRIRWSQGKFLKERLNPEKTTVKYNQDI